MDKGLISKMTFKELKSIAKDLDITNYDKLNKSELLKCVIECMDEYENLISKKHPRFQSDKYQIIKQIGNKGKEGITYLVLNREKNEYQAMKTFSKLKSSKKIEEEGRLQKMASDKGISPKIIEVNIESKFIVMELLDTHLYDIMKLQNGVLSLKQQEQLIYIFKKLDEAKVFHADSNILNYMLKDGKMYIIDFGMSKLIDDKLQTSLKTSTPNLDMMNLGFILKLKELGCPESSYSHLLKYVNEENKSKYGL